MSFPDHWNRPTVYDFARDLTTQGEMQDKLPPIGGQLRSVDWRFDQFDAWELALIGISAR